MFKGENSGSFVFPTVATSTSAGCVSPTESPTKMPTKVPNDVVTRTPTEEPTLILEIDVGIG